MEEKSSNLKLIVLLVVCTYVVSGIGYFLWNSFSEVWAALVIVGPAVGAYVTVFLSKKKVSINIRTNIFPGILVGAAISLAYVSLSVLIMVFMNHQFTNKNVTAVDFIVSCCQWIFAGFCEEVAWLGVLLPLLKKVTKYTKACLLTGVIWCGWHVPMLFITDITKQFTLVEGLCLLLLQIISLAFIMGAISETKYGKSIWTFVAIHAVQNIVILNMDTFLSKGQLRLLDNGYVLVAVLIVFAVLSNVFLVKGRVRKI